jgi:hypothetical protein
MGSVANKRLPAFVEEALEMWTIVSRCFFLVSFFFELHGKFFYGRSKFRMLTTF